MRVSVLRPYIRSWSYGELTLPYFALIISHGSTGRLDRHIALPGFRLFHRHAALPHLKHPCSQIGPFADPFSRSYGSVVRGHGFVISPLVRSFGTPWFLAATQIVVTCSAEFAGLLSVRPLS